MKGPSATSCARSRSASALRRARAAWLAVAVFFAAAAVPAPAAGNAGIGSLPPEELEYELKVEFIRRFADYVEWPSQAFASDSAAFNVCTLGEGPLRRQLQAKLDRGRIKGRNVAVRALKAAQEAGGCHILYIAPSERAEVGNIVRGLGKVPILTIGDTAGFGKRGVLINMFLEGTHIRFAINAPASKANGLNVSAKLLVLSRPGENGG